ncbi:MAG: site-2 protease family protein [Pirellulales bacterium]|nr:site-2 protease family protein [Pirellulales bacterium]
MFLIYNFIETVWWFLQPGNWLTILTVAAGLGFVIFVHELGHFLVAKACGVRCDKFYLGFDVPFGLMLDGLGNRLRRLFNKNAAESKFFSRIVPASLVKFSYGETTYGIGLVPLGGYVKMLGQEDNPATAFAELKELSDLQELIRAGKTDQIRLAKGEQLPTEAEITQRIVHLQSSLNDPRSYLSKSVPQRAAIISAGVIMNVIFAFLMATLAFMLGVQETAPILGQVIPGGAGWEAGLQAQDKILSINDLPVESFENMRELVTLSSHDAELGAKVEVRRGEESLELRVKPQSDVGIPLLRVAAAYTLELIKDPVPHYGPLAVLTKKDLPEESRLQKGDKVIAVEGQPIGSHAEFAAALAKNPAKPIKITIERQDKNIPADSPSPPAPKQLDFTIPPVPVRGFGLVMTLGPITGVQPNSPAKAAGLQIGDQILTIAGQPPGDPLRLDELLREKAGQDVSLTVKRGEKTVDISIKPRPVNWVEFDPSNNQPLSLPSLGVVCKLSTKVASVRPNSPADKAGILPGSIVERILPLAPPEPPPGRLFARPGEPYVFVLPENSIRKSAPDSWSGFLLGLMLAHPEREYQLFLRDPAGNEKDVTLLATDEPENYWHFRMLEFAQARLPLTPLELPAAAAKGWEETSNGLMMVVAFLRKLFTGEISVKMLGGPGTIAGAAGAQASQGFSTFLLFLTMLSANLAVMNILPIPVLDGGHLVFLAYEGITGRPPNPRMMEYLTITGLLLLLGLMLFVISLDIGLISRF